MSTALVTTTPSALAAPTAPGLLFAAFAAFCANPTDLALTGFTDTAKSFIPVTPVALANTAPWRAVTDANAFATGFSEIRVETSKMLRSTAIEEIGRALGYGLKETIVGDELVLTGVEQQTEVENGHMVEGGGKSILTYAFDSSSSRRSAPDFTIAFDVAETRVFHGSDIRLTNRAGANTKGTKLVEGIGPGRCTVQFFVR